MKCWSLMIAAAMSAGWPLAAQRVTQQAPATRDGVTQLTIYNADFAVARTSVPLDLHVGSNEVLTTNVTSQLEPDSVVLRDPMGKWAVHVAEQNYDAGVVTQQWLLEKFEGKTLDFQTYGPQVIETTTGEHRTLPAQTVKGKIVRAGNNPLVEVDGHLQFQLPGMPLFPASTDGLLLKPTLKWTIEAAQPAKFMAELDYITHGMSWQATYNVVVPEAKDVTGPELAEISGWVTIQNNTGADFPKAEIQLMAGDVAKIPQVSNRVMMQSATVNVSGAAGQVTQKEFDDFHLYNLNRTTSLNSGEVKQLQFIEASDVTVQRTYEFDGNEAMYQNFYPGYHNSQPMSGESNTHVAIREEIKNSTANHLGMPLPAGRLRLYRRETTGQMQFVGESMVQHTPAEQTIQVVSGNAFDVTAERRQTEFHVNEGGHVIDETFEIKLSNQKSQAVTVRDVEHMNRGQNWEITEKSTEFAKKDSAMVEFPVVVPAKGEATLKYSVRYTW
jgi:hypothetical protein